MAVDDPRTESISIGRIFERAFAVVGNNPRVVVGSAFLLSALPGLGLDATKTGLQTAFPDQGGAILAVGGLFNFVQSVILNALATGCIVHATIVDSEGARASFTASLGVSVRRLLPVIVVSILVGLVSLVGLLVIIIPGIMVAVMWAVALPVAVEERRGIFGALGRAADLTRGARWRIFGLFLVVMLAILMVSSLVGVASAALLGLSSFNAFVFSPIALIVGALWGTLITVMIATTQAALYIELRDWKDGPVDERLSDIFA